MTECGMNIMIRARDCRMDNSCTEISVNDCGYDSMATILIPYVVHMDNIRVVNDVG